MAERPNENSNTLAVYLDEIGRYELLTAEEEVELGRRIELGREAADFLNANQGNLTIEDEEQLITIMDTGLEARTRFINANLRLVVSVTKQYADPMKPGFLDHLQNGTLGLIRAVDKYDWRRGFKFSTYATWWIRQSVTRHIAETDFTIRLPVHMSDNVGKVRGAKVRLESRGEEVSVEKIADESGLPVGEVQDALTHTKITISINEPVGFDGAVIGDFIPDDEVDVELAATDNLFNAFARGTISKAALENLNDRELEIIIRRFGLSGAERQTLEEIGQSLEITRERVRQIEKKAIAKLRTKSRLLSARLPKAM